MTTIDIALTNVDINQCDKESGGQFQFEIFAGTHRCKNETTQVRSIIGIKVPSTLRWKYLITRFYFCGYLALEARWPCG